MCTLAKKPQIINKFLTFFQACSQRRRRIPELGLLRGGGPRRLQAANGRAPVGGRHLASRAGGRGRSGAAAAGRYDGAAVNIHGETAGVFCGCSRGCSGRGRTQRSAAAFYSTARADHGSVPILRRRGRFLTVAPFAGRTFVPKNTGKYSHFY